MNSTDDIFAPDIDGAIPPVESVGGKARNLALMKKKSGSCARFFRSHNYLF